MFGSLRKEVIKREIMGIVFIGMYEQNRRQCDNDTLKALANFYNVTVDYLLGNDNTTKSINNIGPITTIIACPRYTSVLMSADVNQVIVP